jgi:type II secretory pathway pseudopilin PulG
MYITNMNQKNLLIVSVIVIVALFVALFAVKKNAKAKAQEEVTKRCLPMQEAARQANDIVLNNNVLWSLIDSTWKSPDKSKAFVKKLAETQKLPRCNGKPCAGTEDEAKLRTIISDKATDRSITVGWGSGKDNIKYFFKVIYDDKGSFATIDANDLLGKSASQETEEKAETGGE